MHTHDLYLYPTCHTKLEGNLNFYSNFTWTSVARFLSSLNMEVRDKIELLPYTDLDEVVQLCIRVEQQLKRKPSSKNSTSYSYRKKDQIASLLGVPPSKPKDDKGKNIEEICDTLYSTHTQTYIYIYIYIYKIKG